ncbi:MAG: hypothetical protein AB8C46_25495 [Burkholderiaceae bacterium]
MIRATLIAVALLSSTSAFAAKGEFDNKCVTGLSLKQQIDTDCSINAKKGDKTYCFGNAEAKTMYMSDPEGTVKKATAFWEASKKK